MSIDEETKAAANVKSRDDDSGGGGGSDGEVGSHAEQKVENKQEQVEERKNVTLSRSGSTISSSTSSYSTTLGDIPSPQPSSSSSSSNVVARKVSAGTTSCLSCCHAAIEIEKAIDIEHGLVTGDSVSVGLKMLKEEDTHASAGARPGRGTPTGGGGGGGAVAMGGTGDLRNNCFKWMKLNYKKSKYMRLSYYRNNISFFLTFIVYSIVQIVLASVQFYLYRSANYALRIARVGGILIDFNSGLVVLLVLRRLTTWIRNSVIGRNYLPIDDSIKFHKFIGLFIFFLSFVHTIAHCVNLCKPLACEICFFSLGLLIVLKGHCCFKKIV
jgi:hypothetical protein